MLKTYAAKIPGHNRRRRTMQTRRIQSEVFESQHVAQKRGLTQAKRVFERRRGSPFLARCASSESPSGDGAQKGTDASEASPRAKTGLSLFLPGNAKG